MHFDATMKTVLLYLVQLHYNAREIFTPSHVYITTTGQLLALLAVQWSLLIKDTFGTSHLILCREIAEVISIECVYMSTFGLSLIC